MKLIVSESAIREYLREAMSTGGISSDLTTSPVSVSDVVDPSAAKTQPDNQNFTPTNRAELKVALSSIVDDISDQEASDFYTNVKDSLKEKEKEMKEKDKKVEETVRKVIRKMLSEGWVTDPKTGAEVWQDETKKKPRAGTPGPVVGDLPPVTKVPSSVHGGEFTKRIEKYRGDVAKSLKTWNDDSEEEKKDDDRTRKNVMMTDVGGASFKDMAKELGFASESGAKQAVERIMDKASFVQGMSDEDQQIMILTAMNDYINELLETEAIEPDDAELMRQNPSIVSDLPTFRVYLSKYVKKAMKA